MKPALVKAKPVLGIRVKRAGSDKWEDHGSFPLNAESSTDQAVQTTAAEPGGDEPKE